MNNMYYPKIMSQIHYNHKEQKIRQSQQYIDLRGALKNKTAAQVTKYQSDLLQIDVSSTRGNSDIRQIKEPICVENCTHVVFDLYDIFLVKKIIPCQVCKVEPNKDNIKREQFYSTILQKLNEKAYSCSLIEQQVFHSFTPGTQDNARKLLQNEVYLKVLKEAIDRKSDMMSHFAQNIQRQINQRRHTINANIIIEQPFQCLINCQKIIIPIYLDGCTHLECYEYTNLLQLIEDNNILHKLPFKTFIPLERKCFYADCNNMIPLDINKLKSKIIFPGQLAAVITKELPFTMAVKWKYEQNCFDDSKQKVWDLFPPAISEALQKGEVSSAILIMFKKIANKELPEDLIYKLKFSQYQLNLKGIAYPARCNMCQMQNCRDLREFLVQDQQLKHAKSDMFQCPACNYYHENYGTLDKIVYLDRHLTQAIFNTQQLQPFIYNKNDEFEKYMLLNQKITYKDVKQAYLIDNTNPYPRQICCFTSSELKEPVVIFYCREKRCFEFKVFRQYCFISNFDFTKFPKCECLFCKNRILRLSDFYIDLFFKQILPWFPQKWQENINSLLIKYFVDSLDLIEPQKPKIIHTNPKIQQQDSQNNNRERSQSEIPSGNIYIPPQQLQVQQQQQHQQFIYEEEETFVLHEGNLIPQGQFSSRQLS